MSENDKINGYTQAEAKSLVEYVWQGKKAGKTLTALFQSYGERHGRAKGSVRNYYYSLMRTAKDDARVMKLLDGKELSVGEIKSFTDEETHAALKSILAERSKGISVRRAILNVANGDGKYMLRLQNKYRNVLKKQPEKLAEIERELCDERAPIFGDRTKNTAAYSSANYPTKNTARLEPVAARKEGSGAKTNDGFLYLRLEKEINALYERIARALREENARLKQENETLKSALQNGERNGERGESAAQTDAKQSKKQPVRQ